MNTCPNCGCRVYRLGCVNCDEAAYIDEQIGLNEVYGTEDRSAQEHVLELGAQRKNTDSQIGRVVPRAPQDQHQTTDSSSQVIENKEDHTRSVEPQPGSRTADPRGVDRGSS